MNADDFGLSEEVNEAVIRAFKEGVLTSCSLMVTGAAFDHAVRLAKANQGLAVGIHLVTVMGRAVLPPTEISTLVDSEGRFSNNPPVAGLKYCFSSQARADLKKELAAQFEKFHSSGLPLSHIDSHLHMHVHPVICKAAIELGERWGVRRMRLPKDELGLALRFSRKSFLKKVFFALTFHLLTYFIKKKLKSKSFLFPDRVYGHFQSGKMNESYFLYTLKNLRASSNEIYFHPALYEDRQNLSDKERQSLVEFEALTSQKVIECLKQLEIKLANYPGLEVHP